jgi:hypothetical protein
LESIVLLSIEELLKKGWIYKPGPTARHTPVLSTGCDGLCRHVIEKSLESLIALPPRGVARGFATDTAGRNLVHSPPDGDARGT